MGFLLFLFVSATALGQFIELVETVPVSMNITSVGRSVADAWVAMFASAQKTIDMTSLYVVLSSGFGRGSEKGKEVLNALVAAIKRGVVVRVMVPWPSLSNKAGLDLDFLSSQGALIGKFNWTRIVGSSGMLHAKYLVVDSKHFYSGSADFSWSALARIKQLGVVAWDSPVLAADALRVFNQYWNILNSTAPSQWGPESAALTNASNPDASGVYLSVSPETFCTQFRVPDSKNIVNMVTRASKFVKLGVMDYFTQTMYRGDPPVYWPLLDDAIRAAAARNVTVQILFGIWDQTPTVMFPLWRNLSVVENIDIRILVVPDGGVAHEKFICTEIESYSTTNNFTPDYFLENWTAGLGVTIQTTTLSFAAYFDRDWDSVYAVPIHKYFNWTKRE